MPIAFPIDIPFALNRHVVTVPVTVNASVQKRFIVDTGIGLNLISKKLADLLECRPTGETFTGKRMSGQEGTVPLTRIPSLSLGSYESKEVTAGIFDVKLPADLSEVEGFLSLQFFQDQPFTVDYKSLKLTLENDLSITSRMRVGSQVKVRLEKEGPSIDAFLAIRLPSGRALGVEVDMGSDQLILDSRFMKELSVNSEDPEVRKVEGEDETGYRYIRYFARIKGAICLSEAPKISQVNPDVMFQDIIYDGLVGGNFLQQFVITYDLPHSRLVFRNALDFSS